MTISGCKVAAIFGGTGFIGRHVVQNLARAGYTVKVITRVPERAYFLRPCGTVGQIVPFACDYSDAAGIAAAAEGADVVINCIGILYEKKKGDFERAHVAISEAIAQACRKAGVHRLVHISSLSCDRGTSRYAESKKRGEAAVQRAFPAVTILRPSVVFGPEDEFFNMFAGLARYLPVLPLIGGGKTKFQPVYVGDVAAAVMAALARADAPGEVYELGGPETLDFRQIYEQLFACTGRRRALLSLPFGIAKIQASFLSLLPKPPLTRDQVESLKTDNIVTPGAKTLDDLGIGPTGMSLILPAYLEHYRPGGHFGDKKRA